MDVDKQKWNSVMKKYTFTVDDNIRVFCEITERGYASIFDHPYLGMYKRLHDRFGVSVQLNLFYEMDGFDLSEMTDRYRDEWASVSNWLRMSFHSRLENVKPYEHSDYAEVRGDAEAVHREILRFAGEASLAKTTTIHYCRTTPDGVRAMLDVGAVGLLGLYGTEKSPRTSYSLSEELAAEARRGRVVRCDGMAHASIDLILNNVELDNIEDQLADISDRQRVSLMIHEQYFYPDYERYQPDFEHKLALAFSYMRDHGYESEFFENIIDM